MGSCDCIIVTSSINQSDNQSINQSLHSIPTLSLIVSNNWWVSYFGLLVYHHTHPHWGLPSFSTFPPILYVPPPFSTFTQLPPPRPFYGVPLCCSGWRGEGDNNGDNESMRLEACEWLHSAKPAKQKSSSALPNPKVSLSTTGSLSSIITHWCIHTGIRHTYHCTTTNTHIHIQMWDVHSFNIIGISVFYFSLH